MKVERRLHPRILVKWPAVVIALSGAANGETKDISVDGVFIFCSEEVELSEAFQIVLKPEEQRHISVTAEKAWSGSFKVGNKTVFGMGVRFIEISAEDRGFISTLVEKESKKRAFWG